MRTKPSNSHLSKNLATVFFLTGRLIQQPQTAWVDGSLPLLVGGRREQRESIYALPTSKQWTLGRVVGQLNINEKHAAKEPEIPAQRTTRTRKEQEVHDREHRVRDMQSWHINSQGVKERCTMGGSPRLFGLKPQSYYLRSPQPEVKDLRLK